jgi:hypothetical protein
MGWMVKKAWFYSQQGKEIFIFSVASKLVLESTQPPV